MKKIIKKILDEVCYMLFSSNEQRVLGLINNYEYVSFDIFDTLIKRKVASPEKVFNIVENKYNSKYNGTISNYKENRLKCESIAKKKSNREEVTIEEIYRCMKNYNECEKDRLKEIEIQTELEQCYQNKKMFKIYNECLRANKKIFITSDMYLPENVIEKILSDNGYKSYIKLYLSSSEMVTKKTSNLFKKLLKEHSINVTNIVHIGDSLINDYVSPRKLGIYSVLIKREK